MYHVNIFAPVAYWKKLDAILRHEVPALYESHENMNPPVLEKNQFFTASMILNNIKLIPVDYDMELPTPNEFKRYDMFERHWKAFSPNFVIGPPDLKTCGNHRIQSLIETNDFLAWKNPNSLPITCMVRNLPLENSLQEFFAAISLFQETAGVGSLEVCDYFIEGKIIKIATRYIASKEEYEYYWTQSAKFYEKLEESRKKNHWCIWCFQSFMGLTVQVLSKNLLLENPEHIPKAMSDLAFALHFIQVPLIYISKEVKDFLEIKDGKEAFANYNQFICQIEKELNTDDSVEAFEKLLYVKDIELIHAAMEKYYKDYEQCGMNSDVLVERTQETECSTAVRVFMGADGKVVRKVDRDTRSPFANIMDYAEKKNHRSTKEEGEIIEEHNYSRKRESYTRRDAKPYPRRRTFYSKWNRTNESTAKKSS